jgi:hypothetical protein
MPAPTTSGPMVNGIRGPVFAAIAPILGETVVIRTGSGSIARPASIGE